MHITKSTHSKPFITKSTFCAAATVWQSAQVKRKWIWCQFQLWVIRWWRPTFCQFFNKLHLVVIWCNWQLSLLSSTFIFIWWTSSYRSIALSVSFSHSLPQDNPKKRWKEERRVLQRCRRLRRKRLRGWWEVCLLSSLFSRVATCLFLCEKHNNHEDWQGHQQLSPNSYENKPFQPNQIAPSFHIMIELCYFSLDQWEIKIHLLWGKCFNIPHWSEAFRPMRDSNTFKSLIVVTLI